MASKEQLEQGEREILEFLKEVDAGKFEEGSDDIVAAENWTSDPIYIDPKNTIEAGSNTAQADEEDE